MKLALIVPILNQHELAEVAIDYAIKNLTGEVDVEVIALDNGSDKPFEPEIVSDKLKVVVLDKNIGVYPTFWEALKYTDADILAYIHSDLIICDKGWDERILQEFSSNEKLGLLGFIGTHQVDTSGGRGLGTTSNFQGQQIGKWKGSPAETHGRRNIGFTNSALIDGCAMVFRRSVLEKIEQRKDFAIHHFYDKLLSCEVIEKEFIVGTLGIACDHISGQTCNQENSYRETAKQWSIEHNLPIVYNEDRITPNWDMTIYKYNENYWLTEYRRKGFIPSQVQL